MQTTDQPLSGKVAIVTGAGRGIGKAIARAYARAGAAVCCAARTEADLHETVQAIVAAGGQGLAVPTDVTHLAAVHRMVQVTVETFGGLDILVINAGVQGERRQQLKAHFADECPNVRFPRVLSMAVDPSNHNVVWAGAEVDGVRRSLDGGETWETTGAAVTPGKIGLQLNDPDIHGVAVSSASPTTVLVCTPREIFASTDLGESWQPLGVRQHFPLPYCRSIAVKADNPNVLFVANGDGAAGETGTVQRSTDRGKSWETLPLPVVPNTPIWTFATHSADPSLMLTCSHYGQVFVSDNAGDSWRKVRREFSEIRALAWVPN